MKSNTVFSKTEDCSVQRPNIVILIHSNHNTILLLLHIQVVKFTRICDDNCLVCGIGNS